MGPRRLSSPTPTLPTSRRRAPCPRLIAGAVPYLPAIVRVREDGAPGPARRAAGCRRCTGRAADRPRGVGATAAHPARDRARPGAGAQDERNILAELPAGDPLDDATVLLVGRGRHHATLSVAVGERMGVIGALSVDTAERCLEAREVDAVLIGDGLPASAVERPDRHAGQQRAPPRASGRRCSARFGDVAVLPNAVAARDPQVLLQRVLPLIRQRSFETALKRLLNSIEHKGMIDARTGLLNADAFGRALELSIEDASERRSTFSLARFAFDEPLDRRAGMDMARLVSRLVRNTDFACRHDDGSILFVFGDTEPARRPCGGAAAGERAQAHHAAAGRPRRHQPVGDARHAQARRHRAHFAGPDRAPAGCRGVASGLSVQGQQTRPRMSDNPTALTPVTIDVVSDVVCPWCFIGKSRLEKALALKPNIPVEVRYHPYFLNPWVPREGMSRERVPHDQVRFSRALSGHCRARRRGRRVRGSDLCGRQDEAAAEHARLPPPDPVGAGDRQGRRDEADG